MISKRLYNIYSLNDVEKFIIILMYKRCVKDYNNTIYINDSKIFTIKKLLKMFDKRYGKDYNSIIIILRGGLYICKTLQLRK